MEAGQVDSGFGNQSDQSGNKIQWFEYHMGCAVVPGCFQLIADLAIASQRQAFREYQRLAISGQLQLFG